ncbi:hypothetical protein BDV93DRAFT_562835 [Ceratobasidium sp. AG-I]|nr:hypothetical protein BDV93DRAFT_562835 [Ceratobasidium sp. AG-I]
MARQPPKARSRAQQPTSAANEPAVNNSHTSAQTNPPPLPKRAKQASRKVKELESRSREATHEFNERTRLREETRYQKEVHNPTPEEIRAHNAQAAPREHGPGSYEDYTPSSQ